MKRFLAVLLALFFIACSGEKVPSAKAENVSKKIQPAQSSKFSGIKDVSQLKKGDLVSGKVMQVKDGDTLVVDSEQTITFFICRLYGVDAPETSKHGKLGQPYGEEASKALKKMVLGQNVHVTIMNQDQYHRQVCMIEKDGENVNVQMLVQGYAWAYRQYLHKNLKNQYITFETEARINRRGLWQDKNPENPSDYRKKIKGRKKK